MKVVYPKHIKKGIFSSMQFQVWPLSVSIIQLFVLAGGIAAALGVFNAVGQESRAVWLLFAVPVFLLFVVIAFFQVSELPLIPFIAKLARTYIFDSTRKFQVNYPRPDQVQIAIKETADKEKKQVIDYKTQDGIDKETLDSIQQWGLL